MSCGALLLSAACSHEVESPKLSLAETNTTDPDLVCNAQIETPVTIAGEGFTPAPTNALAQPTVLWLPEVALTRSADLTGEPVEGMPVIISGKADEQDAFVGHSTWQSDTEMTLIVDESLGLEPGLHDLAVTNPDGVHGAVVEQSIAVVPPPVLSEIRPPAICVDQSDIELTLIGENFLQYGDGLPTVTIQDGGGDEVRSYEVTSLAGCVEVPGRAQDAQLCTDAVFTVPQQDLDPGDYQVVLTNPAPAACSSTEPLAVEVNPPPQVDAVSPPAVCTGGSILVASGQDFQQGATGELRCEGGATLQALSVDVNDAGTEATMTFGTGAVAGEQCEVVVINPDGCEDRPLPHESVLGTEGPILFYVAPPVAWAGITTQVKLFVTALMPPFTVSLQPAGGGDGIELEAIQDPGNDRRLQASVPEGTPAGSYDVIVADDTGCLAVLGDGLEVTDTESITLAEILPTFGQQDVAQAVTIVRSGGEPFAPTPLVFLSLSDSSSEPATQLGGVAVLDDSTLTAVVPAGTPAGTYNVIVVDPATGAVGVLQDAYVSTTAPPPVVDEVTPQSIVNGSGQALTIRGQDFSGADVSLDCAAPDGDPETPASVSTAAESCDGSGACSVTATVDGSGLTAGAVCVVRVQNADGAYYDFSAIGVTNSSENLAPSQSGTTLAQPRRALATAAVKATAASRFVYAIGGDTGPAEASSPLASVEIAPVDVFGNMSDWRDSSQPLPDGRSFAASASVGRYIYVYGGSDGSDALSSGARALVLSPRESPVIEDIDLCLSGGDIDCFGETGRTGLEAGAYAYRVAAVIDDADPVNLGGETLASDPLLLRLPDVDGRGIVVELSWSAPVDSEGVELSGVTGYRIYRTPRDGVAGADEVLLASVAGDVTAFIDDGSEALGSDTPLPPGSTSAWQALPALNTARSHLRGVAAPDPDTPGTFYLYALLGKDSGADDDGTGTALSSYEYLEVTTMPNGRQSVGTWTEPGTGFGAARFNHGAWMADSLVSSNIAAGSVYVYVGGGRDGAGNAGLVSGTEAATVGTDGSLSGFVSAHGMSTDRAGFGAVAAANRLFVFAGWPSGSIRSNAESLSISAAPPTLENNVDNEGGLTVGEARFLPGSALQSAFIFIVGGQTDNGGSVTGTSALIVQ